MTGRICPLPCERTTGAKCDRFFSSKDPLKIRDGEFVRLHVDPILADHHFPNQQPDNLDLKR